MTKKMSTPTKPPGRNGSPAWYSRTKPTATARSPATSPRKRSDERFPCRPRPRLEAGSARAGTRADTWSSDLSITRLPRAATCVDCGEAITVRDFVGSAWERERLVGRVR